MIELEPLSADEVLGAGRPEIEALWQRVFPDVSDERFREILPRHARRTGFRFLAARAADGTLAGFSYGYEGHPAE